MTDQDKRRFTRVPFDAEVALRVGGDIWTTDLIDVSLKGLLVLTPAGLVIASGAVLDADILLNEEVSIATECTLMHHTGGRLGLRIDRIDMESIMHLRRLIELNLGNPELLERELNGLGE